MLAHFIRGSKIACYGGKKPVGSGVAINTPASSMFATSIIVASLVAVNLIAVHEVEGSQRR